LDHGLYGHKPQSFPPNRAPKMLESQQLFFKSAPPIGREDSIQTVIRTSRRLDSFLYEAAQNFEVFSNIQN
jgi:hypothetical protein